MFAQIGYNNAVFSPSNEVVDREFVKFVEGVLAEDFEVFFELLL
jgi:hypothetical protein